MPTRSDLTVPLHYWTALSAVTQEGTQKSEETDSSIETELTTERSAATLTFNSIDDGSILLPPSEVASTIYTLGVWKTPTASASYIALFPSTGKSSRKKALTTPARDYPCCPCSITSTCTKIRCACAIAGTACGNCDPGTKCNCSNT